MIKSITIQNYKSIVDLTFELGRFNVLIGANGCGKSNILEAITLAAAANANKLDNEFLRNRGIRETEKPEEMLSSFDFDDLTYKIFANLMNNKFSIKNETEAIDVVKKMIIIITNLDNNLIIPTILLHNIQPYGKWLNYFITIKKESMEDSINIENDSPGFANVFESVRGELKKFILEGQFSAWIKEEYTQKILSSFLTYSPEFSIIRSFESNSSLEPIGFRGERLYELLNNSSPEEIDELKENLSMLDWFDDFKIQIHPFISKPYIELFDLFLAEGKTKIDFRSANEGFFFLLFYFTLFISQNTPRFFAIDNIDNALNPKLARELTRRLVQLAKKKEKQAIVTTHNPAVLDGLDLNDDEQRLFVVRRNLDGHTIIERILTPKQTNISLSEAWGRGYIGGLPDNF